MDDKPSRLDPIDALTLENLHLKATAARSQALALQARFDVELKRINDKYQIDPAHDVIVIDTGAIERKS